MATYIIYSNVTKDLELLTVKAHDLVYLIQTVANSCEKQPGPTVTRSFRPPGPAESVAQSV